MKHLGLDFGRVIQGTPGPNGTADSDFLGAATATAIESPAMPGVFEVLPKLVAEFEGRAWIISKCSERTERKTLAWLDHNDFYDRTGLPRENVIFCRQRAEKAVHCREHAITHMIDDHLEVHEAIRDIVTHRYLFGPQPEPIPDWVTHTRDWHTVAELLIP